MAELPALNAAGILQGDSPAGRVRPRVLFILTPPKGGGLMNGRMRLLKIVPVERSGAEDPPLFIAVH